VGPLAIYISFVVLLIAFSIAVRIYRHTVTRKCHQCGSMVELGRQRCPVCDYRFIS
jgi:hypothetical protein